MSTREFGIKFIYIFVSRMTSSRNSSRHRRVNSLLCEDVQDLTHTTEVQHINRAGLSVGAKIVPVGLALACPGLRPTVTIKRQ